MKNEGNTSNQHASQNVLGDFGSTENFHQQPLTDFSNIINQPPFQQVPEFMSIPPYMLAQYRQEEQKNQALQMFWQQQWYEIQNAEAIRGQNQLPLARIKRIMKSDFDVKEEDSGQAAENPNYATLNVDESLMNMGINVTDQQAKSSQQYTEALTSNPSIVPPPPQFPYNFPPPN
ncbi:nuclear transcription factor Y subunit gamma-like isoform X2 [Senna tora]|uniref:Nuclear transcription factor Y subunit gamma-like isoform X2 n=1 Tax=Senna tora TaxID=362788 RepID=A0A834TGN7_9FABA|nr:nuclear transcription factor Y subunit gamma-like isoform X2 [Senna tora]